MDRIFLERAKALHRAYPVVDAHLDLAAEVYARHLAGERDVVERCYSEHFQAAGLQVIVSSIYVFTSELSDGLHKAMAQIAALKEDMEPIMDCIQVVTSRKELDETLKAGKIAILLSLEGLDPLGTDLYLLRAFYDLGVRGAGLTWSRPNAFAVGCCKASEFKEIPGGLTALGREGVAKMEDLGMYVDVSHLNNEGFADLLQCAHKPFLASHSNAWSVHPNYRNLRDDQIKALAERGGVIGLNANRYIAGISPEKKEMVLHRLCEHVEHLVAKAGAGHVGYGFDLCNGLDRIRPGVDVTALVFDDLLAHHGEMIQLTATLLSRGMEEETAIRIIGGNFLDFYRSVLK